MAQSAILALLDTGLHETVKGTVVFSVMSSAYGYNIVQGLGGALAFFLQDALLVMVLSRRCGLPWLLLSALLVAAVSVWMIQPGIALAADALSAMPGFQDHPDIYNFPYGWQVYLPSYVCFAEPVICSTVMAVLIYPRFADRSMLRWTAVFAVLVVAARGRLAQFLFESFFVLGPLWRGFLSTSQFFLEMLILGMLVAWAWRRFVRGIESGRPSLPSAVAADAAVPFSGVVPR